MRKYTKSEKIEVLSDEETEKIESHLSKTGKVTVSELDDEEMDELRNDLNNTSEH